MKLVRVLAENILSYQKTQINLSTGVTNLHGLKGQGKTNLIHIVKLGLGWDPIQQGIRSALNKKIRNQSDGRGIIELEFDNTNKHLPDHPVSVILRRIIVNKGQGHFQMTKPNTDPDKPGEIWVCSREEVQKYLKPIGYDPNDTSIFMPDGSIANFRDKNQFRLYRAIIPLLGIGELQQAIDEADRRIKILEEELRNLQSERDSLDREIIELRPLVDKWNYYKSMQNEKKLRDRNIKLLEHVHLKNELYRLQEELDKNRSETQQASDKLEHLHLSVKSQEKEKEKQDNICLDLNSQKQANEKQQIELRKKIQKLEDKTIPGLEIRIKDAEKVPFKDIEVWKESLIKAEMNFREFSNQLDTARKSKIHIEKNIQEWTNHNRAAIPSDVQSYHNALMSCGLKPTCLAQCTKLTPQGKSYQKEIETLLSPFAFLPLLYETDIPSTYNSDFKDIHAIIIPKKGKDIGGLTELLQPVNNALKGLQKVLSAFSIDGTLDGLVRLVNGNILRGSEGIINPSEPKPYVFPSDDPNTRINSFKSELKTQLLKIEKLQVNFNKIKHEYHTLNNLKHTMEDLLHLSELKNQLEVLKQEKDTHENVLKRTDGNQKTLENKLIEINGNLISLKRDIEKYRVKVKENKQTISKNEELIPELEENIRITKVIVEGGDSVFGKDEYLKEFMRLRPEAVSRRKEEEKEKLMKINLEIIQFKEGENIEQLEENNNKFELKRKQKEKLINRLSIRKKGRDQVQKDYEDTKKVMHDTAERLLQRANKWFRDIHDMSPFDETGYIDFDARGEKTMPMFSPPNNVDIFPLDRSFAGGSIGQRMITLVRFFVSILLARNDLFKEGHDIVPPQPLLMIDEGDVGTDESGFQEALIEFKRIKDFTKVVLLTHKPVADDYISQAQVIHHPEWGTIINQTPLQELVKPHAE